MEDTKLFQFLLSFEVYELNRFGKFLRSPYFNEDERLTKLFELLAPHLKQHASPALEQQAIWNTIYGDKKFHALKFARLCSDLLKKAEEFLVIDHLKRHEGKKNGYLLRHLTEKKLLKSYPDAAKLARKRLELSPYRDDEYYLHLFQLESSENTFIELQNKRTTEKNLLQTIDALDTFYLVNKLHYLAAVLHYKNFLSLEADVKLMNEVMQHLAKHDYSHVPAIHIYHCIVLSLIERENETHFHSLKNLLTRHYALFPKPVARNMYAFAINFCIRRINFGKLEYVNELFALYKQMLKAGLMTDDEGMLSQFDFKNIVTVALRAEDIKWTDKFIHEYKNNIPKVDRLNAYTFNLAKLYLHQKKYDKVLPLLQDVTYSDIFYQLDSKTTLMKAYYELGDYLPLMSLKESFRILLRRKNLISEQNRLNYMNFIRLTMKLFRADVRNKAKMSGLRKAITESTNVADKGWLMEKMEELGSYNQYF